MTVLATRPPRRLTTKSTLKIVGRPFRNTRSERAMKKAQLLVTVEPLKRGLDCDEDQAERVDKLAQQLEKLNPTLEPLNSELINGKWRLMYTTSESILGKNKNKLFQPKGPIYQTIDAESGRARNQETTPLYNAVRADLVPSGDGTSKVEVLFKTFYLLGFIPVKAPASAKGELEITYLDEDLRICRGDKGNLFVLLMEDPSVRL